MICEFCNKKLSDENIPTRWSDYNVAQHKKFCKSRPSEKSKNHIGLFFGNYIFLFIFTINEFIDYN